MPHLKVEPFDTKLIDKIDSDFLEFRAVSNVNNEIVLVNYKDIKLFLDIVKKDREYLIKPNKITKGSNSLILKEILNKFANLLDLKIVHSNTKVKPFKPKNANSFLKSIEDFYSFNTSFEKIKLEIGFGSARHLLYRAKEEEDTLFIGIEIHTPSINQVLKQINLQKIKNILIVNYDARLLLEMLPSNILDTIYVHFPVPWDKKPHRRVISEFFLREALRTLKKGSVLELRTDSENYYRYSVEIFSSPVKSIFNVQKNSDIEVISKYEARWRRMSKNIYTITVESLEESKDRELIIDFSFKNVAINGIKNKNSIVKDDYFVHFGKEYKTKKGFVVECSFGSFNIPEKKILVVDGKNSYYLPSLPVKSLINQKAHNLIKEVLNG